MVLLEICDPEYPTLDSAYTAIEKTVITFYQEDYPEIFEEQRDKINRAIDAMKSAFSKNIFPEMKVRWDVYPDHIGHQEFNGCFRCHNDRHISEKASSRSF